MTGQETPLGPIARSIARGLEGRGFAGSIRLDCGGDGAILIRDGAVTQEEGPADCTIFLSAENLAGLIAGRFNPMTGKLKVGGDAAVAMRLGRLLR